MNDARCTRIARIIPRHVEGDAFPFESFECAAHISSCTSCAEEEGRARRVLVLLRSLRKPAAPDRDIAGRVMARLRTARRSIGKGAALKWSSLGGLLLLLAVPGPIPNATIRLGVRFVTRLGELLDPEAILARTLDLLPGLLPSLTSPVDAARGGVSSGGGGLPPAGSLMLVALGSLAAAFVLTLLSGGLFLRAGDSARDARIAASKPTSRSFDNPGRLP